MTDKQTLGFGIMAVPDSAYTFCREAVRYASENHRVVVVSYTLLVPFALSLYLIAQRLGLSVRLGQAEQAIGTAHTALQQAHKFLENMAKEIITIQNQRKTAIEQVETALRCLKDLGRGEVSLPTRNSLTNPEA